MVATFVGGWGHAEPLLPMARLAVEQGHEVVFAGQSAIVPRMGALGFRTIVVGPDTLVSSRQAMVPVDREAERTVLRDHFVARFGRSRAAALRQVFEQERPQMVVCDEGDVGAVVAAELLDIRCVTVIVLAAGRMTTAAVVGDAWQALRSDHGLRADPDLERFGGDLRIAAIPRSFRAPEVAVPRSLRLVRHPILDGLGSVHGRHQPLVYATLGTVFNLESGDLPDRLVAAAALVDAEVVVSTGPGIDPDEFSVAPTNVRLEAFVDQSDVLPRCQAVVCHGGSGTLMATLALGVPVVVLPMGADQLDNADRCAELGVGLVLDALTATPADIAEAIETVRRDGRYRRAAEQLAAEAAGQPCLRDLPEIRTFLER